MEKSVYCGAIRLEQNRYNREPNNAKKEQSIDRSVESFQYDSMAVVVCVSLGGAENTIFFYACHRLPHCKWIKWTLAVML